MRRPGIQSGRSAFDVFIVFSFSSGLPTGRSDGCATLPTYLPQQTVSLKGLGNSNIQYSSSSTIWELGLFVQYLQGGRGGVAPH